MMINAVRTDHDSGSAAAAVSGRFGFYAAIATAALAILTFGFAIVAVPISGSACPANCVDYPYLNTAAQYPKDFRWMPLAIVLVLAYVAFMVSIHAAAPGQKKIFSQVGLSFAVIAAAVLLVDYFVQFSVIPISLMSSETQGLAALIQYNPHGIFIALEELGYLLMALSFLCMAPVLAGRTRLETAAQWIFIAAFILAIVSLAAVSILYGLDRQYRFEIIVISIDWLALIVNGIFLGIAFRRQMKAA
jgi:hypothetical protein